jgi:hypothetical protein
MQDWFKSAARQFMLAGVSVTAAAKQQAGIDCPFCSNRLRWMQIRFASSFRCPGCGSHLCVPRSYSGRMSLVSLISTIVIGYWLGARGAFASRRGSRRAPQTVRRAPRTSPCKSNVIRASPVLLTGSLPLPTRNLSLAPAVSRCLR